MKKAILGAMLVVAATGPAVAEDKGSISGSISTTEGVPVRGYPVVVTSETPSGEVQNWITSTDTNGVFAVDQLPEGRYVVAPANVPAAARAFEISPDVVKPASSGAPTLKMQLAPKDLF